jgi:hypothetical protein
MGVKLVSSSGGSVEINPPTTASNFTATMPAGTGNVVVNGINGALVAGTAVASTSGTSIDFTGIPSWVRRITVMFSGVSTNGTSPPVLRVGAGSIQSTGYVCTAQVLQNAQAVNGGEVTTSFPLHPTSVAASATLTGSMTLSLLNANVWVCSIAINRSQDVAQAIVGSGSVALSGTLDRVRITTVNGTDTFDAGSINILYE